MRETSVKIIAEMAKKRGFPHIANGRIQRILRNPTYAGLVVVRPYLDNPQELVEGINEKIIDRVTFQAVQSCFKMPSPHIQIDENLPLRSVLRCYCGNPLSGAPSKNKVGNWYYYYKCRHSKHLNLSAIKAHDQFDAILRELSIEKRIIKRIEDRTRKLAGEKLLGNK